MITIIQHKDGRVLLHFPYHAALPTAPIVPNIPKGMEEWLSENTDVKWTYGATHKVGAEITREDLVAFKLKFPL